MNKRKFTIRQKVQKCYKECFDDYDENEFMDFFSKVMEKCKEGYSLNNAFRYCQIDKIKEDMVKELLKNE